VAFAGERAGVLVVCSGAGIDAEKLRNHLSLSEQRGPDGMDELLKERERSQRHDL
jgi:hypothetical protein